MSTDCILYLLQIGEIAGVACTHLLTDHQEAQCRQVGQQTRHRLDEVKSTLATIEKAKITNDDIILVIAALVASRLALVRGEKAGMDIATDGDSGEIAGKGCKM